MFDRATGIDLPIIATACVLAGLAVGMLVYLFGARVADSARTAAAPNSLQRQRRRRAASGSGAPGLVSGLAPALGSIARVLPLGSVRASLVERYERAGWPGDLDDDELMGVGLLAGLPIAAVAILLILIAFPLAAPLGLVAVVAGPGLVSSWLRNHAESRDLKITRTMPFVLDLLVLTIRAGAPFPVAMERVALDYARHPIGVEFRGVLADMELGVTRNDALENLANRVPIPAIRTFADDLNQAEELGRPVADTLQRLSDQARERRILDATESAGRAKVMVLIPGMLVFVAALILLFSPFAVRYFYGGLGEF